MGKNSMQNLNDIARLFSQIQGHVNALSGDAAGIVQLFFDLRVSISDITHIYESSPDKIKEIISDFLVELIAKNYELQRFLPCFHSVNKNVIADLKAEVNLLIEASETPDSTGARIKEIIGTAIRIGIPPLPSNLLAETISKINVTNKVDKIPIKEIKLGGSRFLKDSRKTSLGHKK
jgi:hypothetical protein